MIYVFSNGVFLRVLHSYVLLHHVMGEIDGLKGAWAYVEGGMGSVSEAIASSARSHGASLFTNKVRIFLDIISRLSSS